MRRPAIFRLSTEGISRIHSPDEKTALRYFLRYFPYVTFHTLLLIRYFPYVTLTGIGDGEKIMLWMERTEGSSRSMKEWGFLQDRKARAGAMRKGAAMRTSVPKAFGKESSRSFRTDRHMHAGGSKMDAERPETSTFVHFSRKGRVMLCPLLLLEKAAIGHAYRADGPSRYIYCLVFTPQSGG